MALFGTVALLALSGAATASAGVCAASAPDTVLCDGDFNGTVGSDLPLPIVDLTLVLGSESPTSVVPGAGLAGVSLDGSGNLGFVNFGSITSIDADGVHLNGTGSVLFENHGDIGTSAATAGVEAVDLNSDGDISISNDGSISSSGSANYYYTYAIKAFATNGDVGFENLAGGSITASATGAAAIGFDVYAYFGAVHAVNHGTIEAYSANGSAVGMRGRSGGGATIENTGGISVISQGFGSNAIGVLARSHEDANGVSVVNTGDIAVTAGSPGAVAAGISATGIYSPSVEVVNSGSISASAAYSNSFGIDGVGSHSDLHILNEGDIHVDGQVATGIHGFGLYANVAVENTGRIEGEGAGYGIWIGTSHGDIAATNSGSISMADPTNGQLSAITAVTANSDIDVLNSGDIDLTGGHLFGTILINNADADPTAELQALDFSNTGSITVSADLPSEQPVLNVYAGFAVGVYANTGDGPMRLENSGTISASTYSYSAIAGVTQGISAVSTNGDVSIGNSGSIDAWLQASSVYGGGVAVGITVLNSFGDVAVSNTGTIAAAVQSDYFADSGQVFGAGVSVNNDFGDTTIANGAGASIAAEASSLHYSTASAVGADIATLTGIARIDNAGAIVASTTSGATSDVGYFGQTTAVGAQISNSFGDLSSVTNLAGGSISADASADFFGAANAFGISIYASAGTVDVSNAGDISAAASAVGHVDESDGATAVGVLVTDSGAITATFTNATGASISANASADLSALASGADLTGTALRAISDGGISATASASAVDGLALATGLSAFGTDVEVTLGSGSDISSTASGAYGTAIGVLVAGANVAASNAGAIAAQFVGAGGNTYGAIIAADGDVSFTNSGSISALGSEFAVGLQLSGGLSTTFINSGTLSAGAATAGGIALLTGDSQDRVGNSGTISGAVLTGAGNDRFDNLADGVWTTSGASDFGAGDDSLVNAGTVHLQGATVSFGESDTLGNLFDNAGLITLSGSNTFDMGSASADLFRNTGLLDMQNGLANDALTVNGNFAGGGQLNVDLVDGHIDQFYVDGDVAGGATTINVAIGGTTVDIPLDVPVVRVSGDSTAADFVVGTVTYAPEALLALGFTLDSDIDASNGRDDVFSLALEVAGLTDPATLAASLGAGAQGLMTSQVGSWRQRMGVINSIVRGRFGVWARLFKDDGVVNPDHAAGNFGQTGNFAYDQDNSGTEVGIDFGLSEQFSAGLLLARADSTQRLTALGAGSNRIEGNTVGVYATWLSPSGFYLDASYRRMSFDAQVRSVAGEGRTEGDASTVNLEAGYGWTFGDNVTLQPQLQYTRTEVDGMDDFAGALAGFHAEGGVSSRGRLGLLLSQSFSARELTWSPYVSLSVVREFDGEQGYRVEGNQAIPATGAFFGSTGSEGTSTLVEAGLNLQAGAWSIFGGANRQDGGAYDSIVGAQLGARLAW